MLLGVGSEISMLPAVPGATSAPCHHGLSPSGPSSIVALVTVFYHSDRKELIHLPHLWE